MKKIIFSPACLEYRSPGHPESPERVATAYKNLAEHCEVVKPSNAADSDILKVHTPEHLATIKMQSFYDLDSPAYDNIYYYASLAAGAAIKAQEIGAFSLMRPPGHHAGKDYLGGFCYFNNIAIAVKKSAKKTLIVDIDGHHGNGTEDIFLKDSQVVFISLHRKGIFPGTGNRSQDNIYNYPLSGGIGDKKWWTVFEEALEQVAKEKFEQIAISAGFDAHIRDPLASLGLSTSLYEEAGRRLAEFKLPSFAVLEGGYVGSDLGENILAFIKGLSS